MSWRAWMGLLVLSGGCFMQNASPQARAMDAVQHLNDHSRWGRAHAAIVNVESSYQKRFMQRRAQWGRDVQIADVEIQNMQLINDNDEAVSVVDVSWYLLNNMQLEHTWIKQNWTRDGEHFLLSSEQVVEGDDVIFGSSAN